MNQRGTALARAQRRPSGSRQPLGAAGPPWARCCCWLAGAGGLVLHPPQPPARPPQLGSLLPARPRPRRDAPACCHSPPAAQRSPRPVPVGPLPGRAALAGPRVAGQRGRRHACCTCAASSCCARARATPPSSTCAACGDDSRAGELARRARYHLGMAYWQAQEPALALADAARRSRRLAEPLPGLGPAGRGRRRTPRTVVSGLDGRLFVRRRQLYARIHLRQRHLAANAAQGRARRSGRGFR